MKKYLKLLMVAIFATMSFAFVACGDDDDEPDGGTGSSSHSITLKLDGKTCQFDAGLCEHDSQDEIVIEFFDSKTLYPWIGFVFYEAKDLTDGMVLTPDMDLSNGIGPLSLLNMNYGDKTSGGYILKSGSVKIDSINLNGKFKVTFNNARFVEFIFMEEAITVNGTFTVNVDTRWGYSFLARNSTNL